MQRRIQTAQRRQTEPDGCAMLARLGCCARLLPSVHLTGNKA